MQRSRATKVHFGRKIKAPKEKVLEWSKLEFRMANARTKIWAGVLEALGRKTECRALEEAEQILGREADLKFNQAMDDGDKFWSLKANKL